MPSEFGSLVFVDCVLYTGIATLDSHFPFGHLSGARIPTCSNLGQQLQGARLHELVFYLGK